MIKYLLAAASLILFVAGCSPSSSDDVKAEKGPPAALASYETSRVKPQSDGGGIPVQVKFAASVGEVVFEHEKHIKDRSLECVQCHHQINAKKLNTPHPDYLKSSWVNCQVCHDGSAKNVYSCSECHRSKPENIADETLSAKVVIHAQCAKCHDIGRGKEASDRCVFCHTRKKAPAAEDVAGIEPNRQGQ